MKSMANPDYIEMVGPLYKKALASRVDRLIDWAGAMKGIRQRADNKFTRKGNEPIHVIYIDELPLANRFMDFARDLKEYARGGLEWDIEANHYSVVRVLQNDDEFELKLKIESGDLGHLERFLKADGFVTEEQIFREGAHLPIIYIRPSSVRNLPRYMQIKRHEQSHAFSMGFDEPEKLFGYWLEDDGEGEMLVRHKVDEYIANIETEEELRDTHLPIIYCCGDEKGLERFQKMADATRISASSAREKMPRLKQEHRYDLANLLRLIPVQIMDEVLPRAIDHYLQQGYHQMDSGIPVPEAIDK